MSNWYGTARSNYILVKDYDAFKEALEPWPIKVYRGDAVTNVVCLVSEEQDSGGWPSMTWGPDPGDPDMETEIEFDPAKLICPHMVEGQVLVMMEAGAEKARYVTGNAVAYNHKGEHVQVNLVDIYDKAAAAFGVQRSAITSCVPRRRRRQARRLTYHTLTC